MSAVAMVEVIAPDGYCSHCGTPLQPRWHMDGFDRKTGERLFWKEVYCPRSFDWFGLGPAFTRHSHLRIDWEPYPASKWGMTEEEAYRLVGVDE
jgi:hypothetical protein